MLYIFILSYSRFIYAINDDDNDIKIKYKISENQQLEP